MYLMRTSFFVVHELRSIGGDYRGRPRESQVRVMNLSPADDAPKGSDDEQRVGNYVVTKKDNLVLGREV